MTPETFIAKWKASELKERSASQSHFNDLCALLNELTPTDADPKGDWYCFERGASKTTGSEGWADVWKRHHFGWEYKGKRKDLDAAFAQLQQYAVALENPPLLVVCDMERFRIHTNWTNTVSEVHEFALDDLMNAEKRQLLKWVFSEPSHLKPRLTRDALTEQAASEFAALALSLRQRGHEPHKVAHFINRLVFCMFAEDVHLLPDNLFTQMLEATLHHPSEFQLHAQQLFAGMQSGGVVAFKKIEWFNGGLFDSDEALPLNRNDIDLVLRAARMNWSDIDPSILGTLFERGLDPDKRSQLGAHYTDREKIMMIVEPVVMRPLEEEWQETKKRIEAEIVKARKSKGGAKTRALNTAERHRQVFMQRLRSFRVLDPACGSGNFLYLSLLSLKDLEHRINLDCEALGLQREFPSIGPEVVKGIEINPYAAELTRVTVWIGEIQWMKRNGFSVSRNPILKPLNNIECRDAVIESGDTKVEWPKASVIVGNPPFLGGKLLRDGLGDIYVDQLFAAYKGEVSAEADLVCYWFSKAWELVDKNRLEKVGLVATNSIRGGANRSILDRISRNGSIFEAWDDEPWVVEGAAVRVSLVCFGPPDLIVEHRLDGRYVGKIHSDLTAGAVDFTEAAALSENQGVAFMGDTKGGAFNISGAQARDWLRLPVNPNGRPNSDVLRPWINGMDITRRGLDRWIIDFGWELGESEAALYEEPFAHIDSHVRSKREQKRRKEYRDYWWRHYRPRPAMWQALRSLLRFVVTPTLAKHRLFSWCEATVCPDHQLIVIARDDDTTFGILHSRLHELWALRKGTSLEDRPRYTPTTTFETFPFPEGMTPNMRSEEYADDQRAQGIAVAAKRLNELRENWLNPSDLVRREPEVVPCYPDRILPADDKAAAILKKRTLTNLYNERPTWLDNAHRDLDEAVAEAYGWSADLDDDEALQRLFELNQKRSFARGLS